MLSHPLLLRLEPVGALPVRLRRKLGLDLVERARQGLRVLRDGRRNVGRGPRRLDLRNRFHRRRDRRRHAKRRRTARRGDGTDVGARLRLACFRIVLLDGGEDLAVGRQHRLDALAGVEGELIDRRQIGGVAHGDGHHLAAPRPGDLVRDHVQLLGDLLGDQLHRPRIDLRLLELHRRDPEMLAEDCHQLVLAAEPLLHHDGADLPAPLFLVPEGALELGLVDDLQLGEKLPKSLARRHPISVTCSSRATGTPRARTRPSR